VVEFVFVSGEGAVLLDSGALRVASPSFMAKVETEALGSPAASSTGRVWAEESGEMVSDA
jgi:hypothetical protein